MSIRDALYRCLPQELELNNNNAILLFSTKLISSIEVPFSIHVYFNLNDEMIDFNVSNGGGYAINGAKLNNISYFKLASFKLASLDNTNVREYYLILSTGISGTCNIKKEILYGNDAFNKLTSNIATGITVDYTKTNDDTKVIGKTYYTKEAGTNNYVVATIPNAFEEGVTYYEVKCKKNDDTDIDTDMELIYNISNDTNRSSFNYNHTSFNGYDTTPREVNKIIGQTVTIDNNEMPSSIEGFNQITSKDITVDRLTITGENGYDKSKLITITNGDDGKQILNLPEGSLALTGDIKLQSLQSNKSDGNGKGTPTFIIDNDGNATFNSITSLTSNKFFIDNNGKITIADHLITGKGIIAKENSIRANAGNIGVCTTNFATNNIETAVVNIQNLPANIDDGQKFLILFNNDGISGYPTKLKLQFLRPDNTIASHEKPLFVNSKRNNSHLLKKGWHIVYYLINNQTPSNTGFYTTSNSIDTKSNNGTIIAGDRFISANGLATMGDILISKGGLKISNTSAFTDVFFDVDVNNATDRKVTIGTTSTDCKLIVNGDLTVKRITGDFKLAGNFVCKPITNVNNVYIGICKTVSSSKEKFVMLFNSSSTNDAGISYNNDFYIYFVNDNNARPGNTTGTSADDGLFIKYNSTANRGIRIYIDNTFASVNNYTLKRGWHKFTMVEGSNGYKQNTTSEPIFATSIYSLNNSDSLLAPTNIYANDIASNNIKTISNAEIGGSLTVTGETNLNNSLKIKNGVNITSTDIFNDKSLIKLTNNDNVIANVRLLSNSTTSNDVTTYSNLLRLSLLRGNKTTIDTSSDGTVQENEEALIFSSSSNNSGSISSAIYPYSNTVNLGRLSNQFKEIVSKDLVVTGVASINNINTVITNKNVNVNFFNTDGCHARDATNNSNNANATYNKGEYWHSINFNDSANSLFAKVEGGSINNSTDTSNALRLSVFARTSDVEKYYLDFISSENKDKNNNRIAPTVSLIPSNNGIIDIGNRNYKFGSIYTNTLNINNTKGSDNAESIIINCDTASAKKQSILFRKSGTAFAKLSGEADSNKNNLELTIRDSTSNNSNDNYSISLKSYHTTTTTNGTSTTNKYCNFAPSTSGIDLGNDTNRWQTLYLSGSVASQGGITLQNASKNDIGTIRTTTGGSGNDVYTQLSIGVKKPSSSGSDGSLIIRKFNTSTSIYPSDNISCSLGGTGVNAFVKGYINTIYTSSDRRLKENIKSFDYTTRKSILNLPTYTYNYIKDEDKKPEIGCMAQDLKELYPELVSGSEDTSYSINESKLVYLLLEEVKLLKKEIEELKKGK